MKRSCRWILFVLILALVCLNASSPTRAQFYCNPSEVEDGDGEDSPPPPPPPECDSGTYITYHITGDTQSCNSGDDDTAGVRVDVYQTSYLVCNGQIISSNTVQVGTLCCNGGYCDSTPY
jgi:hypothetical protein